MQVITIASALQGYAMQENTELTAYAMDSIDCKGFGKKMQQNSILTVDEAEHGSRLDRALIRHLGAEKRSLILRLIRKGNVRVNKKRCKPELRLSQGDAIYLPASLREPAMRQEGAIPALLLRRVAEMPVLFEDEQLLLVNKPAGIVVHGGSGHDAGLIEALKQLRGLDELRLAHRLDRDTSGLLLLVKELAALRALTASFRERDLQKTYFALVAGHPFAHAGRMCSKLAKGAVRGGERVVIDADDGKESVTDFQVMMHFSRDGFDYAMLALHPHSGRTHQLRVQLQNEGHPILGDNKYADRDQLRVFRALGGRGLMLHAWRLRFERPVTGRPLEFIAPWPDSWRPFLIHG